MNFTLKDLRVHVSVNNAVSGKEFEAQYAHNQAILALGGIRADAGVLVQDLTDMDRIRVPFIPLIKSLKVPETPPPQTETPPPQLEVKAGEKYNARIFCKQRVNDTPMYVVYQKGQQKMAAIFNNPNHAKKWHATEKDSPTAWIKLGTAIGFASYEEITHTAEGNGQIELAAAKIPDTINLTALSKKKDKYNARVFYAPGGNEGPTYVIYLDGHAEPDVLFNCKPHLKEWHSPSANGTSHLWVPLNRIIARRNHLEITHKAEGNEQVELAAKALPATVNLVELSRNKYKLYHARIFKKSDGPRSQSIVIIFRVDNKGPSAIYNHSTKEGEWQDPQDQHQLNWSNPEQLAFPTSGFEEITHTREGNEWLSAARYALPHKIDLEELTL